MTQATSFLHLDEENGKLSFHAERNRMCWEAARNRSPFKYARYEFADVFFIEKKVFSHTQNNNERLLFFFNSPVAILMQLQASWKKMNEIRFHKTKRRNFVFGARLVRNKSNKRAIWLLTLRLKKCILEFENPNGFGNLVQREPTEHLH